MDDTTRNESHDEREESPATHVAAEQARHHGFPAVLGHEVVALNCVARGDYDSAESGYVVLVRRAGGSAGQGTGTGAGAEVREGTVAVTEHRLPTERLWVWARAGRVTFTEKGGEAVHLTLLGETEAEGLELGAPWPRTHTASRASNIAHGAMDDVKNVVTFPSSFPRMMRTSGERNAVLDALVGFCQREIPGIHVLRGWPRGAEGPTSRQAPALPHKGLMGEPGWLAGTRGVGADQETWAWMEKPAKGDRQEEKTRVEESRMENSG